MNTKVRPLYDSIPPKGERLIIQKNGSTILLPYAYAINDDGKVTWRKQEKERAFAHGSIAYGDGKVDARKIKLSVHVRGVTQKEYDEKYNNLLATFAGEDYALVCGREDRIYKVAAMTAVSQKYQKGFKQRWSDIDITLMLADPFRYATNQILIQREFVEEQQDTEINFQNPSSVDVPLILTFKPLKSATANSIMLVHAQTGKSMQLRDTLLTNPAVSVVNSEKGTVYRDTANSLNTFSGIFLHATPGINTLKYTGSSCCIDIAFTARWFV